MRYYCSESENSKQIVDGFIKMCESKEQIFMTGPSGSEFQLLVKEYCEHFRADLESVVWLQVDALDEATLGDVVRMLKGRESPGIIVIDTRGHYNEVSEAVLFRFLDNPAFSNARFFILLEDFDPFENQELYSASFVERAKSSLFMLPLLADRAADIGYFSMSLLDQYTKSLGAEGQLAFNQEAVDLMLEYPWPGNYGELENVIRVLVYAGVKNDVITRERLEDVLNLQRTSEFKA